MHSYRISFGEPPKSRNIGMFLGPWRYLAARTGQPTSSTMLLFKLQWTVPHEDTYQLVRRMICHEGRVSSFINKRNQFQSFLSDHNLLKQYTFLVWSDVLYTQTQRNFPLEISLHQNYNATLVRIASFWKEAVLLSLAPCHSTISSGGKSIRLWTGLLKEMTTRVTDHWCRNMQADVASCGVAI